MGKLKKKKQGFMYNRNRRREWKNQKKGPAILCEQIKDAWNEHQSVQKNLAEMGLSSDPNKTFPIPLAKDMLVTEVSMDQLKEMRKTRKGTKIRVMQSLEAEATLPQAKRLRLSEPEVEYCSYMIEKYADDYKAMARDYKNYFQDTPKQIRKKINTFKGIPEQYNKYLESQNTAKISS